MSEELNQPSGPVAGTTESDTQAETPEVTGQEEAQPQFITRAEAAAMEQKILNQARSYADKGRVRVEKAVADVTQAIATMRTLGQTVTPEQEKALKDEATRKAMTEPDPAPTVEQPSQVAQQQGQIDPEILAIQSETGVELFDGDPELAMLVRDKGPRKWYQSIEAAHQAKKTRLASQQSSTNPTARVPAGGAPANKLPENMTAREAWARLQHKT